MFCPETIIVNWRWLYVVRHDSGDYTRASLIPWRERFNPLRLEIIFRVGAYPNTRRVKINRGARLHLWLSNLTWRLWRERQWKRQRRAERPLPPSLDGRR